MAGKFEMYNDKVGEFRFRLKASNGQVVLASQGYNTKAAAQNGVRSVQENSGLPARFEKSRTESGQFRFNLTAANRQIIGQGQGYKSAASRDKGILAVGRAAQGASVEDLTT